MQVETARQRTLKAPIGCVGTALHSGRRVSLTLCPGAPDQGIVLRRSDLGAALPARFDMVAETHLCTVIADPARPEVRFGTVEHVLAALVGCGIDNAVVEVDGPELPILDGSAASFVFLIECAGTIEQDAARRVIDVLRPVRVLEGDAFAELQPGARGFELALSIDFAAPAIGRQALSLELDAASFRNELSRARTFGLAHEVEQLRRAGMALGGSLQNAIVVDGAKILNPAGLRMPDEFVRHKMLDVVGDMALAGASFRARFQGHRSGHGLNNRLLRALFADATAWRLAETNRVADLRSGSSGIPLPAAAFPA